PCRHAPDRRPRRPRRQHQARADRRRQRQLRRPDRPAQPEGPAGADGVGRCQGRVLARRDDARDARGHRHAGAEAVRHDPERGLDARAPAGPEGRRQPRERRDEDHADHGRPRRVPAASCSGRCTVSFETNGSATHDRTRVFVTGSCEGSATLCQALAHQPDLELVGVAEHVHEATGALAGGHLQVVLHATSDATLPSDELAVIREHTRAPIIVLASGEASQLMEQALEEDVADVLLLPQMPENVFFAIRKASHSGRRSLGATVPSASHGRIVTVFSPKGGTGKTVITTNLATALAKHEGKRTLLLDMDLQFGDAAIMLGLEPEKTIYDLVSAPGELDPEKLAGYTTRHVSGFDILPAPLRPEDAELVTEAKIGRLLEVARTSYDVIVVDTSPF